MLHCWGELAGLPPSSWWVYCCPCVGGTGLIGCDDSYALNCVSYSSSVALFECSEALDVTPLAFCSFLHIGLFKSVQVLGVVRRRGASLYSSSLILPYLREELSLTFFLFFGLPPSLRVPLCPLLNLSPIPLVCLLFCSSVSWLLFELLFHSFLSLSFSLYFISLLYIDLSFILPHPPLCLVGSSIFLLSIFPALVFLFPTSMSGSSILLFFFFFPRQTMLSHGAQTLGSTSQALVAWLVGLSIVICPCLNWPLETARVTEGQTPLEKEDRKAMKAGSYPAYPNCWCYKL